MVYPLKIIYWLLVFEAIGRTVYFWQLKEYRADRFREFLFTSDARRYFLPTRHWLKPKVTFKAILVVMMSLYFTALLPFGWGYLAIPLLSALAVAIINPLSDLIKQLIMAAAKIKISRHRLTVIGITGSYGKTAMKEILAHLLSGQFRVLKTAGNNNTLIGVAKTILFSLKGNYQIFVVEMGAYRIGEIKSICRLVKPQIGILTGINQQHAGLFGNMANIIRAKSELIEALPSSGLAIINGENENTQTIAAKTHSVAVKLYRRPKSAYLTNLIGGYQQLNISGAAAAAKYLGMTDKQIQSRLKDIPDFKTALKQIKGLNGARIILDSYNSNRNGFMAAIEYCGGLKFKRKYLITSGISELGKFKADVHREISVKAVSVFDQILITKADIHSYFKSSALISESELIKKLSADLTSNDLVLLEGRLSDKFIKEICAR